MAFELFDEKSAWLEAPVLPDELFADPPDQNLIKWPPDPDHPELDRRLESTHILFREEPGFDDMYIRAEKLIERMVDDFKIMPVNVDNDRIMYLARFEIVRYKREFQHPEAVINKKDKSQPASNEQILGTAAWIDFLSGFPLGVCELLSLVGEITSRPDYQNQLLETQQSDGGPVPVFPQTLFGGYEEAKIALNIIYLDGENYDSLADDLKDEEVVKGLHWWVRANLPNGNDLDPSVSLKFPYPGEFMCMAVRLMMERFWDSQESSPFLFAGNWLDTVFFSSGFVNTLEEATAEFPWKPVKTQWRINPLLENDDGLYILRPTDFSDYQTPDQNTDTGYGDRVTLLKDISATKPSELWRDEDMSPPLNTAKTQVVPIMFYGIDPDKPL